MRVGRRGGDTWWWNEAVRVAISWKSEAHNVMCHSSAEENRKRYEGMTKKAVTKETLTE